MSEDRELPRGLSERLIARQALEIVDDSGVEGLSMRRLAADLNVSAMAVYHHLADKDAVQEAVAQMLLAEVEAPRDGEWKEVLRAIMRSVRRIGLDHPNAIPLLTRYPPRTQDALAFVEAGFRACRRSGFGPQMTARAYRTLAAYSLGSFDLELGGYFGAPDVGDESGALDHPRGARHLPNVAEIAPLLEGQDPDVEFEFGLELVLAGLEAAHSAE